MVLEDHVNLAVFNVVEVHSLHQSISSEINENLLNFTYNLAVSLNFISKVHPMVSEAG